MNWSLTDLPPQYRDQVRQQIGGRLHEPTEQRKRGIVEAPSREEFHRLALELLPVDRFFSGRLQPEQAVQAEIVRRFDELIRGGWAMLPFFADNANSFPKHLAKVAKMIGGLRRAMGLVAGVTDLVVLAYPARVGFLECKASQRQLDMLAGLRLDGTTRAPRKGQLSPEQQTFRDLCAAGCFPWAKVHGAVEAEAAVQGWWGVP
jgi:hypothetical protein